MVDAWPADATPRTPELKALQADPDPKVAEGSACLFDYVELHCKLAYRVR